MGRRNRQRQARHAEADRQVRASLARRFVDAPLPEDFYGFGIARQALINRYQHYFLKPPSDWRCRLKSRDEGRRFVDLVKFTFARFPTPDHLTECWTEARPCQTLAGVDLREWWLAVAQGRSLYRTIARRWLSKMEAHHFLMAPKGLTSGHACWYAVARVGTTAAQAANVARTKLADRFPIANPYGREIAQYFARNPATIHDMDDLIDFLQATKLEDHTFSLKGRSLLSLRRKTEEWHRALAKQASIGGDSWAGYPIADSEYEIGSGDQRARWRFRQIKSGDELFVEGQRMHHCVASYKARCMKGTVSIWSASSESVSGTWHRGVTLELNEAHEIVQCRGFANRAPSPKERQVVARFADENGLVWRGR